MLEIWTLHATWRHACWIVYVPRVDSHQGPRMPGVHTAHRAAHPYQSKREPGYHTLSKQAARRAAHPLQSQREPGYHAVSKQPEHLRRQSNLGPTRGSTEAPWSAGQGVHPSPTLSTPPSSAGQGVHPSPTLNTPPSSAGQGVHPSPTLSAPKPHRRFMECSSMSHACPSVEARSGADHVVPPASLIPDALTEPTTREPRRSTPHGLSLR